jgi:hypothetical protein
MTADLRRWHNALVASLRECDYHSQDKQEKANDG